VVFVLYFIRILPQKGFQNSRKQSNFNLNARNFVCGWGSAPDPFVCVCVCVGVHIVPHAHPLSGREKEEKGTLWGGKGREVGGKGKGRWDPQSL